MIGDPSGRSDMRKMLTTEQIEHNCECFKKQMSRFIDFSDDKALSCQQRRLVVKVNYASCSAKSAQRFSVNNMLRA